MSALKKVARLILPSRIKLAIREAMRQQGTFDGDGLFTVHVSDFLSDPKFIAAYGKGVATGSWGAMDIRYRAYIACWAAAKGRLLPGDFVECGVNLGGLSRTAMEYTDFNASTKQFWLLDTYCGIPEEQRDSAADNHVVGRTEDLYDRVVETFREYPRARIVRGSVPQTLPQVTADKVCYLSIDMNCAEPEIAAAEYFWDRLSPGAVMVLDDYAYSELYAKQRHAFDEFCRHRSVQVLCLPTGQGLIFKPS